MKHVRVMLALILIFALLGIGTIQFHYSEKWSWIDSFYFTGSIIAPLSSGGVSPKETSNKLFVVFYSILATGVYIIAITEITENLFKRRFENMYSFFAKTLNHKKQKVTQTTLACFKK